MRAIIPVPPGDPNRAFPGAGPSRSDVSRLSISYYVIASSHPPEIRGSHFPSCLRAFVVKVRPTSTANGGTMKRLVLLVGFILSIATFVRAEQLQKGDYVAVIGDSITEQRK